MSSIEFDPKAFARAVDQVMQDQGDQLQAVYDRVLQEGEGKSLQDVKVLLRNEFHATFGTKIRTRTSRRVLRCLNPDDASRFAALEFVNDNVSSTSCGDHLRVN